MPFTGINWKEEAEYFRQAGEQELSMADIARHFGVSRQRIKQVLAQYYPDWTDKYGHGVVREKRVSARQREFVNRWGHKESTDLYIAKRAKYRAKRYSALRGGIEFSIPFGELDFPTHCPILGLELDYFAETRQENSVSFDRIDPNKGYVVGNVLVLSWRANRIKNDGTSEEHRLIADFLDTLHNISIDASPT